MKKILIVAIAFVAAIFVGCAKDDINGVNKDGVVNGQLKFNFTVADKPASIDTRALKSGWAVGDQIMVMFLNKNNWKSTNTLVIEYNGSYWEEKATPNTEGWTTTGQLKFEAIHYRRIDTTQNLNGGDISQGMFCQLLNVKGGEVLTHFGNYTIADGVVSVAIELDYAKDIFLVSIPDLSEADDWRLGILEGDTVPETFTRTNISTHYPISRYNDNISSGTLRKWTNSTLASIYVNSPSIDKQALARCVQNDGQITFAFGFDGSKGSAATYTFFLSKGLCSESSERYIYTVNSVAFSGKKAYKLPSITENGKWQTTTSYIAQ